MISNIKNRAACLAEQTFNPKSYSNCPDLQGGIPGLPRNRTPLKPTLVKKNTHCFFAYIALGMDARIATTPQATTNMLIEVTAKALANASKRKHLKVSALTALQKEKLARRIATTAALDYLQSEPEFSNFRLQRFVDFNLIENPTYLSIRLPPTKVLPNDSKIWRLAQSESDKLRGEQLSQLPPSPLNKAKKNPAPKRLMLTNGIDEGTIAQRLHAVTPDPTPILIDQIVESDSFNPDTHPTLAPK